MITLTLLHPAYSPTGALLAPSGKAYDLEVLYEWTCRDTTGATAITEDLLHDLRDRALDESDRETLQRGGFIDLGDGFRIDVLHGPVVSDWPSNRDAHDEATYGRMFEPWHEARRMRASEFIRIAALEAQAADLATRIATAPNDDKDELLRDAIATRARILDLCGPQ